MFTIHLLRVIVACHRKFLRRVGLFLMELFTALIFYFILFFFFCSTIFVALITFFFCLFLIAGENEISGVNPGKLHSGHVVKQGLEWISKTLTALVNRGLVK